MKKRFVSILLCAVLLVSIIPITANADELVFYNVQFDAGNGVQTERAIVEGGEIYIPASSFSKYTRFEYHADIQSFLVVGQRADKAFKKVVVNAETKLAAVGTKLINLRNSFVVDGIPYLPFCQMLPILNADIFAVNSGVIYITNPDISMDEVLYDFNITDYAFNISDEFFGDYRLAFGYVFPNLLFDTVVGMRFDRLDIVFDTGTSLDYQSIFKDYFKDDDLYHEAMKEDNAKWLLDTATELSKYGKILYDVYDWFEKIEKFEIEADLQDVFEYEKLELFIKKGYADGEFDDELKQILGVFFDSDVIKNDIFQDITLGGLSFVDGIKAVDYLYSLINQVDDHKNMLDVVYGISGEQLEPELVPGASSHYYSIDLERFAAIEVYELYSGNILPEFNKKMTEEVAKRLFKGRTIYDAYGIYGLTAGLSGKLIELFIPGDSEDRALLPLHANIVNSALRKSSVPTLDTVESTDAYRLSLLLTLIASRKCYKTLLETPSLFIKQDTTYYANRIKAIEEKIKELYLVAGNVAFDTYENYETFAKQNLKIIEQSGILSQILNNQSSRLDPAELNLMYVEFLQNHPEYVYYAILDVNQDGTPELLATESDCSQWGSAFAEVDLFVYRDGEIQLAYENLWSKNTNLMYSKDNQWIVASVSGTGGGGWVFYHLDHNLNVHEQSFESYFEYDENGNEISVDYLNSRKVVTEEDRKAFEQLAARHQFEETSEIIFQPVMGNDASTLMNNRLSKIKIVREDGSEYEHLFYYNESGKLSLIEQSGYEWSHYDYNFSYNGDGRLIKMESGDIEQDFYEYKGREFSYDDMGRITTARVFGPGMGWETIHFSYGNDGHISQMEIAIEFEDDPSVYAFNYDTSRNLSEVKSIYPEYDYRSVWSYQYDQWNRVTKEVHTEQYSDGTEYVDELSYSYDYAPFVFCYSEYNIRVYYDFGLLYGEMLNPWISENANVFEPADFYFDEIVDIATDEHGQITALTVTSDYSEGTTTYYFFYSDETNSVENTETKERFQYKNINFSASDILSFEDPEFERFLCVMLGKNRGTITGQDLLSIEYFGYFEGSPTEAESLTNYWDKDTLYWNSVLVSTELCPDFLDERDVLCLTAGEDGLNYRRRGTLVIVQSNEWMAEHVFPYLYYFKNVDRFAFAYCWMGDLVCMPTDANWCQINAHSRDFHLPYDPDYS